MKMYATLPVVASAYPNTKKRSPKTHIVHLSTGTPACGLVAQPSILKDFALAEPVEAATCRACQKELKRNPTEFQKEAA